MRLQEPIDGPTQAVFAFDLDKLFPGTAVHQRPIRGGGYLVRFYVGGVPPRQQR